MADSTGKVAAIAKLTAPEGKRDELVAVLRDLVKTVGDNEPDTLVYALHTDASDEQTVWFYELYASVEASKAHSSGRALKEIGARLGGLVTGAPEVHRLVPQAAHGLDV